MRGRRLPGPPLSQKSQTVTLLEANVTVGIGAALSDKVLNTRFDAGWVRSLLHTFYFRPCPY